MSEEPELLKSLKVTGKKRKLFAQLEKALDEGKDVRLVVEDEEPEVKEIEVTHTKGDPTVAVFGSDKAIFPVNCGYDLKGLKRRLWRMFFPHLTIFGLLLLFPFFGLLKSPVVIMGFDVGVGIGYSLILFLVFAVGYLLFYRTFCEFFFLRRLIKNVEAEGKSLLKKEGKWIVD